ncbi:hypothetical protein DIURU_000312 [Diutina rugosa]|uniref:Peptidase A1 domain-containing protein n=1 Tax=Diutina rugosa TaxID=5481 RepID=A0A642V4Y4_DIURU|nr:uncharacterized protein DIURU_000312 [Diutina rugosa]KAA8907902.1 hypothetical protein DIURU_000312 [Diutina rugosa]
MLVFNLCSLLALASALVVPQESDALEKRDDPKVVEAILDFEGRQFHPTVKVGSSGETFHPTLDSGSAETWFVNNNDWVHHSTSLVNLTTPFHVGFLGSKKPRTGYYVTDTMYFDNTKTENLQFGLVDEWDTTSNKRGLIGLARWTGKYDTLPFHLKTTGQVERNVASIWYSTKRDTGKLIFGGFDQAKVGSEWTTHSDPKTFKVPVVKVTTGGVDHYPDFGDYPIVVDTGASNSLLPRAIVKPIAEYYNATLVGKEYEVSCNPPEGSFQLTLGSLELDIPLKEFVHQAPGKAEGICTIGASIAEDRGNVTLIGTSLISRVVTLFDYEKGEVSMAKLIDTPEENIVAAK